jgi:hypothetical protein
MTPFEIKDYFGIDITQKKRDNTLVYLRAIWMQENIHKLEIRQIAFYLKKDRTTIVNLIKKYPEYKKDPLFKLIYKSYKNKDKDMLKKVQKYFSIKQIDANFKSQMKALQKIKVEIKIQEPKAKYIKPHILEVSKNLRNIDTYLNNKVYTNWKTEDFEHYEQIKQA